LVVERLWYGAKSGGLIFLLHGDVAIFPKPILNNVNKKSLPQGVLKISL
jgi:hypothetical protein